MTTYTYYKICDEIMNKIKSTQHINMEGGSKKIKNKKGSKSKKVTENNIKNKKHVDGSTSSNKNKNNNNLPLNYSDM